MIKMPVLLDKQLHEMRRLHPVSMPATISADDLSAATMTLTEGDGPVILGDWVRIYTPQGDAGVYVVRSIEENMVQHLRTVDLEHAFGILMDFTAKGEHHPSHMGGSYSQVSAGNAIRYFLSKQPEQQAYWQLGVCEFDREQGWQFTDPTIYQALTTITQSLPGWAWRFHMDELPFTVDLVRRPSVPTCEMRMNRNISTMTKTVDKNGMITRLYPIGRDGITLATPGYVERNTDVWGVISKVRRDEASTSPAMLETWANEQLDVLSVPRVSISISGLELSALTGEPMDRLIPGTVCRVPLPEYGTTVEERIITMTWGDMMADEMSVTITMANSQELLTNVIMRLDSGTDEEAKEIREKAEKAEKAASESVRKITTLEDERITPLVRDYAKLTVTADAITGVVQKFNYDNTGDMLEAWGTKIQQAATGVDIQAIWQGIDENTGRLETAEAALGIRPGSVSIFAKKDEVSSYINVTGDGVTISGGIITLDGKVVFEAMEAEFKALFAESMSSSAVSVGSISGADGDFDELRCGSINGTYYYKSTLKIGNKTCEFFAPQDATFDWSDVEEVQAAINAARIEGAEAVTLRVYEWSNGAATIVASNGKQDVVRLPPFEVYEGQWTSEWKKTINFATESVNVPLETVTVDASGIYDEGFNAVTIEANKLTCQNVGPNLFYVTATASNGAYVSRQLRINVGQ